MENVQANTSVETKVEESKDNSCVNNGDTPRVKENNNRSGGRRDRDRNRSRRRSRSPVRSREDRSSKVHRRVYVANIPFDVRWGELKDLFRDKVGNVRFCQLFENEEGKPRGCGLVEFEDSASANKAIEVLNRFNFKGRELVVKEDLDIERDRYGRLILSNRNDRDRNRDRDRDIRRSRYDDGYPNGSDSGSTQYQTYGLSPQFLASLGIKGPLNNRIFVANLDYKVSEHKLEDIFKMAGKVTKIRLYSDHEGKSKGFGVVEFDHPVEAVQAISMFNNQKLYDRILSVRLDKFDNEDTYDGLPARLPRGLESIGKGLGVGGQPLNIMKSVNNPVPPMTGVPAPTPAQPIPVTPQTASAAMTVLTNLAGIPNLPTLTQSLAQISNTSGLGNSTMAPTTFPSAPNEAANVSTNSAYPSYSTVVHPHTNGTGQPTPYTSGQMLGPPSDYGTSNISSTVYSATTPAAGSAAISSYSTYDQRDYRDEKPYRNTGIDTIIVRNLPPNFSWQNLRDRFNEVAEVRFAEMKGLGTALVRFGSDRDAQKAVDLMNGLRIENRTIDVSIYY